MLDLLEKLTPLFIFALFAATRFWLLPHLDFDVIDILFGPLEIAAYSVSVYALTRNNSPLLLIYSLLPVATLLWKETFNYLTVLANLI